MKNEQSLTSAEFLTALKKRKHDAISLLVDKYSKQLFNTSLGQGLNEDQAEEMVQSTWTSFFEGIDRFEGRSHVRTYLFGILYNKIKEFWRYQKRYAEWGDDDSIDRIIDQQFDRFGIWKQETLDPEKFAISIESRDLIEICLKQLDKKYHMAFFLKEVAGEKSSDICNILEVTRTNLGVLIFRAKHLLRKCLEKKYLEKEQK